MFSWCLQVPGESSPWLQVFPVKPGWHLHLLGPTQSPCLQPGWHTAVQGGFKEEETDQRSTLADYLYQIRMTKHLILQLLDFHNPLAVNYLFTSHYSNKTEWCLIHKRNVCLFLLVWQCYYHWLMIIECPFSANHVTFSDFFFHSTQHWILEKFYWY